MNAQKRNRIIAATTVTVVLLLVVLVAVMIYQIVEICVLDKRKKEIQQEIAQYEEKMKNYNDLMDYFSTFEGSQDLLIQYDALKEYYSSWEDYINSLVQYDSMTK